MIELTNNNYDNFKTKTGQKILILGASWCRPCKALLKRWSCFDIDVYYADLTNGKTGKIKRNINITKIPMTIIYNGQTELKRLYGLYDPEDINELTLTPKPDGVKSCGNYNL